MVSTILVTGATGKLGTPTTELLRAAGHEVRALSRRPGPGHTVGDLVTCQGISEAVAGVDTVVHCATGRQDVHQGRSMIGAAVAAGVEHFVLISIVGCDRIPLGYYRGKVEIEHTLEESGLPFTIQRATQFYHLVDSVFRVQRYLPALLAPSFSLQPVPVEAVARILAQLASGAPQGRVADVGGPRVRSAHELAEAWRTAAGTRRPIWDIRPPGKIMAALRAGHNLATQNPVGEESFEDYLAKR